MLQLLFSILIGYLGILDFLNALFNFWMVSFDLSMDLYFYMKLVYFDITYYAY